MPDWKQPVSWIDQSARPSGGVCDGTLKLTAQTVSLRHSPSLCPADWIGGYAVLCAMDPFENMPEQPMQMFRDWLTLAEQTEPNDPNAAALATCTMESVPSVRMVLVKGVEDRGVRFFTHTGSQKGEELHANPHAAMCLHWKSLRRQVRFAGRVERLSREEAGQYFHTRSRGSQIAAAVSEQSQPLPSRETMDAAVRAFADKLGDAEVPTPEDWAGFLLVPQHIEFWSDGRDRLHDRMRFTLNQEAWSAERLYP